MPADIDRLIESIEQIRLRYQGHSEWLKAPNGQHSKLSENHWLLVRTSEFKSWFGDWERGEGSQILDQNGEPLVLYHGTNADFDSFRIGPAVNGRELGDGIYLATDATIAEKYGDRIMPVFCNLRNPFNRDPRRETVWFEPDNAGIQAAKSLFSEKQLEWEERGAGFERFCPEVVEDAVGRIGISYAVSWEREPAASHDGVWSSGSVCVAFAAEQIRSALAIRDFCKPEDPEEEFGLSPR